MTGEFRHSLDSKGRLFIPARLREEIGDSFIITISMDGCLSAYSCENWQLFSEKASSIPYVQQRRMRPVFAYAARCELDGQGRVLVPQVLREYAGLEKSVAVVGCNNHIEMWNADRWEAVSAEENKPENIMSVMKELNF